VMRKAIIAMLTLLAVAFGGAWIWVSAGGRSIPLLSQGAYRWRVDVSVYNLGKSLRIVFPRGTGQRGGPPMTSRHEFTSAARQTVVGPWLGFSYKHTVEVSRDRTFRVTGIDLPLWMLTAACGSYPLIAFLRGPGRGWRRRRQGRCAFCGYILVGNTSGVCSECGGQIRDRKGTDP